MATNSENWEDLSKVDQHDQERGGEKEKDEGSSRDEQAHDQAADDRTDGKKRSKAHVASAVGKARRKNEASNSASKPSNMASEDSTDKAQDERLARFVPLVETSEAANHEEGSSTPVEAPPPPPEETPVGTSEEGYLGHNIYRELSSVPAIEDSISYLVQLHNDSLEYPEPAAYALTYLAYSIYHGFDYAKDVLAFMDSSRRSVTPEQLLRLSDDVEDEVYKRLQQGDEYFAGWIESFLDYFYFLKRPPPEMKGSLRHFMRQKEAKVVKSVKGHWLVDNRVVNGANKAYTNARDTIFFWKADPVEDASE